MSQRMTPGVLVGEVVNQIELKCIHLIDYQYLPSTRNLLLRFTAERL